MSSLLELPVELAALIVSECDCKTLLTLCITSKSCQAMAQKLLYRQVDLRSLTSCVLCFRTLLVRHDLAVVVRDLLILFDSNDPIFSVFWTMLADVLSLTINVVSLHFASPGPSNIIFRHCAFPRLRTFSSVLVLSEELCDFLTRHPSITQLCIGGEVVHQRLSLPASALPTLETYLGSRSLARDVIPGRPVSHITLAWTTRIPDMEIEDVVRTLAMATVPVRHFGCTTFGADANRGIMRALAAYMPGLHTLRINNISSGKPTDEKFTSTIAAIVQSFKELKRLDIPSFVNANDDTYDDCQEEAEAKLVFNWNASCPSLESVTLPSCVKWSFKHDERLWRRDTDDDTATGTLLF